MGRLPWWLQAAWKMEEVFFPGERNQKWWGRKILGTVGANCPSSACCACQGWGNVEDGTVLEAREMASQSLRFTLTDKCWHQHSPCSSLSWNLDKWFSHQMLPFSHLPETPLLFSSFHCRKLCPSECLQSWNWFQYHNSLTAVPATMLLHIPGSVLGQVPLPSDCPFPSLLEVGTGIVWRYQWNQVTAIKNSIQLLQSKDPVNLNGATSTGNAVN